MMKRLTHSRLTKSFDYCLTLKTKSIEEQEMVHLQQFIDILSKDFVNKRQLSKLSKNGIAKQVRGKVWKILIGYIPCESNKQKENLHNKRKDYLLMTNKLLEGGLTLNEEKCEEQIIKDLNRLTRDIPFLFHNKIQQLMKRLLLTYAIKHPASGYVQGMSDMVVPFLVVYIDEYYFGSYEQKVIDMFSQTELDELEADVYWSFCWILQSIQSHYTYDQPGIHHELKELEMLTKKYNKRVDEHFKQLNMQYIQFAFRWFNCCLIREFPINLSLILWDGYISEPNGNGFEELNLYCCCSLLEIFSTTILQKDFAELIVFLQNLPTKNWTKNDIQQLLLKAYAIYTMEHLE
ncbi:tbc domain containing protein [Entamoeba histolytica]|nr:tbc domain containing protein [Entamoeba histolytica]